MTAWADRLADRSPVVQRNRERTIQQARVLIDASRRLLVDQQENFTTHELAKEAGVALQTVYRYFAGKDDLLLAVLEDMVGEAAGFYAEWVDASATPLERLHSHLTAVLASLEAENGATRRFVAAEHWRLSQLYPDEVAQAVQPFVDLLEADIRAATAAGLLRSEDPSRDAWLLNQLLLSVFHHHSFAALDDPTLPDDLWRFALRALGGGTT